jgi:predicted nucleic acid-binding protein
VKRIVLDPGGFLAWFTPEGRGLRGDYEAGGLEVHVPTGFALDVLERVARQPAAGRDHLGQLADELERLGFREHDVSPVDAARPLERGRNARQAAYVALSTALDLVLVTDDPALLGAVGGARRPAEA